MTSPMFPQNPFSVASPYPSTEKNVSPRLELASHYTSHFPLSPIQPKQPSGMGLSSPFSSHLCLAE